MKNFLAICFLIITKSIVAQQLLCISPRQVADLNAYSTEQQNIFGCIQNPASISKLQQPGTGLYAERKYLLEELNYYSLVTAINGASGGFGLHIEYAGSANYNESGASLAYGRVLGNAVSTGLQLGVHTIAIKGYGSTAVFSARFGTMWQLNPKLATGFYFTHALNRKFGKYKEERWPATYAMGFGYDASPRVFLGTEIVKQEGQAATVNVLVQYHFAEAVKVFMGISSGNTGLCAGVFYLLKSIELGVRTSYHPQLGISPGLQIIFHFAKNNAEKK